MSGATVGRLSRAYYSTGTTAVPVWVELKRLADLDIPQSRNTSTFVTRESANQKTVVGAKVFQITGTYIPKLAADAVLTAIKDSFDADGEDAMMDIAVMDRDIAETGADGIRGPWACTSFGRAEPVEGVVSRSLTFDEIDYEEAGVLINVARYTTA